MFKQIVLLFLILLAGLLLLYVADIKLFRLAAMMLRIDLFAFGGGFASVPLMLHELLFYVTLKFALAVPWDIVRLLFGLGALIALAKRVDVLYVVLIGAAISIVVL